MVEVKTSPAHFSGPSLGQALRHCTVIPTSQMGDGPRSQEHAGAPPRCTGAKEEVNTSRGTKASRRGRQDTRQEEEPGPVETEVSALPCMRCRDRGGRAPSFPGGTYCAARRQPWCNAAPCRRQGEHAWLHPAVGGRSEGGPGSGV